MEDLSDVIEPVSSKKWNFVFFGENTTGVYRIGNRNSEVIAVDNPESL